MSRRALSLKQKNYWRVDPLYNSSLASRFICCLMVSGKKSLSTSIFYDALNEAANRCEEQPLEFLQKIVSNVRPEVEVKTRRVSGSNFQVPIKVSDERGEVLAVRWILAAARSKSGSSMVHRLATEFSDAYNNTGLAIRKKEEVHKVADSNRAYSHFRW